MITVQHPVHGFLLLYHKVSNDEAPIVITTASAAANVLYTSTGICVRYALHRLRRTSPESFQLIVADTDFPPEKNERGESVAVRALDGTRAHGLKLYLWLGPEVDSWMFVSWESFLFDSCNFHLSSGRNAVTLPAGLRSERQVGKRHRQHGRRLNPLSINRMGKALKKIRRGPSRIRRVAVQEDLAHLPCPRDACHIFRGTGCPLRAVLSGLAFPHSPLKTLSSGIHTFDEAGTLVGDIPFLNEEITQDCTR